DGEYQAARKLAQAASVMAADPAALQLRLLQTVVEVAAETNSRAIVAPVPVELLRFLDRAASAAGRAPPPPQPAPPPPQHPPPDGHRRPASGPVLATAGRRTPPPWRRRHRCQAHSRVPLSPAPLPSTAPTPPMPAFPAGGLRRREARRKRLTPACWPA